MKFRNDLTRKQRLRLLGTTLGVGLVLCLVTLAFPAPFERLDSNVYRSLTRQRMTHRPNEDQRAFVKEAGRKMVLVQVDDASLRARNLTWPIPRTLHAELIRRLDKLGAKTIGFDIMFNKPAKDEVEDAALAEALKNPKVVLTFPFHIEGDGELTPGYPYAPLVEGWTEKDFERRLGFTADWSNRGQRFATLRVNQLDRERYYSLATVMLAHFRGIHPAEAMEDLSLSSWLLEIQAIEVEARGAQVNPVAFGLPNTAQSYLGQVTLGEVIQVLSLDDILSLEEQDLNPETLGTDKFLALVGVSAKGGFDEKETVLGSISGVELHINVLFNMMRDDFVREIPQLLLPLLVLAMVLGLGTAGAFLSQRAFIGAALVVILGLSWFARSLVLGSFGAIVWPPLFAPLFVATILVIMVPVLLGQAQRAKLNKMLDVMKEVCPAGDLDQILEKGLKAGGERRELTILFSDLRNYTTFVETHKETVEILDFLNLYYGCVSHIFERYGGTVLDYQGDAQMVVFGLVEESKPNHAAAAIKAGVEIILTLDRLREAKRKEGLEIPDTGVGICTGEVSFGVLGNARRKQYVAIGDPTNTAARLQGKSADIGERVLAARSSRVFAGGEVLMDFVDEMPLKGKKQTIGVFAARVEEMVEKDMVVVDDDLPEVAR